MDDMKQAPKRYGMKHADFAAGYACCDMEEPGEAMEADDKAAETPAKWGGFLTRNNTWERI